MVSCQKGPTCHVHARQIGPFWQDTLDMLYALWRRVGSAVECGILDLDLGPILPVRRLGEPLGKALHVALLLSTQNEISNHEGRFMNHGAKLRVSDCILPGVEKHIKMDIWIVKAQWPGKYLSKSAEQSSEPRCGLRTVTLLFLMFQSIF